jgi:REP element-mobilizing transposase RayT
MGSPLRIEYTGAFYHVTSRGNERKDVFKSRRDREQFLEYLESATVRYGASIHVYCLMSNHYHLLIETPGGNLIANHAAHKRCVHELLQCKEKAVGTPVPGQIQGPAC